MRSLRLKRLFDVAASAAGLLLLAQSPDPERTYVETVLPAKLALCQQYVRERSLLLDLKIIAMTLGILLKP